MDPILRRSSFYYATSAVTYLVIMGRYLLTRDWPAFETIPLFMPVWIVSALMASESDERYAFLRTLPVPDRIIARRKFAIILGSAVFQWVLMTAAATARMGEGVADASTLVYLTFVCLFGLLAAAGFQIGIWRFGFAAMKPVLIVTIVVGILAIVAHLASLKTVGGWPALSRLGLVQWLGRAPWVSSAALIALALVAYRGLMTIGVRVKAESEAHL
jgi:hypothetical protein